MTNELLTRAYAAYFRSGGGETPNDRYSSVEEVKDPQHGTQQYVVLCNGRNEILAVYRVRRYDRYLKRLKRWPRALEANNSH